MNTNNKLLAYFAIGCTLLIATACTKTTVETIKQGDVPIHFSASLKTHVLTKLTETTFEAEDRIGLFALLPSTTLSEQRYIDNLLLETENGTNFIPEQIVYYPEDNTPLSFIAYYPYRKEGLASGVSSLPISVQADQSTKESLSQSDFLVAKKENITSSEENVSLEFEHKLSKLNISLIPGEGEDLASILAANPAIIVTGIKTEASYDFENNTISSLQVEKDIIPYGTWNEDAEKLIGKELIILPQALDSQHQSIILEWNGKIYTCLMPDINIGIGQQCEITIEVEQQQSEILNGVAGSITGWDDIEGGSSNNQQANKVIHLSSLSFSSSAIYQIYRQGKPIAEICKEYLISGDPDGLTSRALVHYPINSATQKIDLQNGTVLQLLDTEEAICGGKLSWNTDDEGFTYQKGDKDIVDKFYIGEDGNIIQEIGSLSAVDVNLINYQLRDIRGQEVINYPIVKIGKQHWMQEDLRTIYYQDGTAMTLYDDTGLGAGYFHPDETDVFLYNGEAVLAGELAPRGWKIPTTQDWEELNQYIGQDVSSIKTGTWSVFADGEVASVTNFTGLSIYPQGIWLNEEYSSAGKIAGYWALDETGEAIPEEVIFFTGESNEIVSSPSLVNSTDHYKALSIRCIAE